MPHTDELRYSILQKEITLPKKKSKKQKILFKVKCPLNYTIFLDLITWNKHILKNHPKDMAGREADVKLTVLAPDEIRKSKLPNRTNLIYWKTFKLEKLNKYLKVVTKIIGDKEALVVTSHPDNYISGGKRVWPS